MSGWMIVLIVLVLLLLLLNLHLGVRACYGPDGPLVMARAGLLYIQVFPGKQKRKKKKPKKAKEKKPKEKPDWKRLLPMIQELIPVGLEAMTGFRRRLHIDEFRLNLIWGEEDPADAAIHYGYIWGALETLLSFLEANFVLVRRDVALDLDLDYQREKPEVCFCLGLSLTLGQCLAVGLPAAFQALKILLKHRKRKRAAPLQSAGE